jgi:hypothetical protein
MCDESAAKTDKKQDFAARWALFTSLGSFLVYLFGYLVLRFHLSVLGVDTGLSVLDSRYFFAGAQFLVYLLTSVPLALVLFFVVRWIARRLRPAFLDRPDRMLVSGVVVSIVLIQVVTRQCLPLTNVLLSRDSLSAPAWIQAILFDGRNILQPLYFIVLVAVTLCITWLWLAANRHAIKPSPLLNGILACLVFIQMLLLPVNFGILIANQDTPRVTTMNGKDMLPPEVQAWRVWEGADSVTFFVRRWERGEETPRTLLTLDKKSISRTEIFRYDKLRNLLADQKNPSRPR